VILQEIHKYAMLSNLAYVRWDSSNSSIPDDIIRAVVAANRSTSSWAASYFQKPSLDRWSIPSPAIHTNDATGFAATLFVSAGEKVLAIRGTEFENTLPELLFAFLPGVSLGEQTLLDLFAADLEEIVGLGIAMAQATSLVNYVLRHSTAVGVAVPQFALQRATSFDFAASPIPVGAPGFSTGTPGPGGARTWYWLTETTTTGTGLLQAGERISVVGHSLGGHLAALALRLFPQVFDQGVVFNAAGFDAPESRRLTDAFVRLVTPLLPAPPAADFTSLGPRLQNLVSESSTRDDDLAVVPSVLTGIGALTPVGTVRTELNSHGMDPLMDDLAALALLERLGPTLDRAALFRLFDAASTRGAGSMEALVTGLAGVLLPTSPAFAEVASGWLGYASDAAVFERRSALQDAVLEMNAVVAANPALRLEPLLGLSSAELIARARTSVAYRHALHEYLPFALVGDDARHARHNALGVLDESAMSLSELADRVALYQHEMSRRLADLDEGYVLGSDARRFHDLGRQIEFLVRDILPETQPDLIGTVVIGADGIDAGGAAAGSPLRDRIHGASGDDHLAGGGGADYLNGGRGHDMLEGGSGADTLEGGDGNDTLYGSQASGADDGASDVLIGGPGFDRLFAGPGDFVLDADGELLVLIGHDWLPVAGRAFRALQGGDDVRVLRSEDSAGLVLAYHANSRELRVGNVTVLDFDPGELGLDLVALPAPPPVLPVIRGSAGADRLTGGAPAERIEGGAGDDELNGQGGADDLIGEAGHDALDGGSGDDRLDGGAGRDRLEGHTGRDTLLGGEEADVLAGGADDDVLDGGSGDDVLGGGTGRDTLVGGDGNDLLSAELHFDRPAIGWTIERYGSAASQALRDPRSVQLIGFNGVDTTALNRPRDLAGDLLYGGHGDDLLFGSAGRDFIDGGPGDDTALGGDGDDVLHGSAGRDHLRGSGGADVIDGGDGDDFIVGHGSGNEGAKPDGGDRLQGGDGDDELQGGPGNDILHGDAGADRLFGDDDDDELHGDVGDDALIGDGGNDLLLGGDGDDRLFGNAGADVLDGGADRDFLDGGEGADVLRGGAQADQLHGGDGADTLFGEANDDLLLGGAGDDFLDGGSGADTLDGGAGHDRYRFDAGTGDDVLRDVSGVDELHLVAVRSASALDVREQAAALVIAWDGTNSVRIRDWRSGTVDRLRIGPSLVLDRAHFLTPQRAGRVRALSEFPAVAAGAMVGTGGDDDIVLDASALSITAGDGNDRYLLPAQTGAVRLRLDDTSGDNTLQFQGEVSLHDIALSLDGDDYVIALGQHRLSLSPTSVARYAFGDGTELSAGEFRQHLLNLVPVAPRLAQPLDNHAIHLGQSFQFSLPPGTFVDLNPGASVTYAATLDNGNPLPAWLQFDPVNRLFSGHPPDAAVGSHVLRVTATDDDGLVAHDSFGLDVLPSLHRAPGAVFAYQAVNGVNGFWLAPPLSAGAAAAAPLIAAVGDLNADGFDDFMVGDTVRFGRARGFGVQLDGPALDGYDSFQLLNYVNEGFPYANSGLLPRGGDFNGDGIGDLWLPAPDGSGAARVLVGRRGRYASSIDYQLLPVLPAPVAPQPPPLYYEGRSVVDSSALEAGDFNGDGLTDFLVTVASDTAARTWRGVVFGQATGQATPVHLDAPNGRHALRILADAYGGYPFTEPDGALAASGWGPLLPLGDINDDGHADIGLGSAPFLFQAQTAYAAVIFGRADGHGGVFDVGAATGANGFLVTLPNPPVAYSAAHLVRAAGDLNGDGYDDVFAVDDATGAAYALYGRAAFSGVMHAGTPGNDVIHVQADAMTHAGPGDDTLIVPMSISGTLFGGSGHNTFIFTLPTTQLEGRTLHRIDAHGGLHQDTYEILGAGRIALHIRDGIGVPNTLKFGAGIASFDFVLKQGSVLLDFGPDGPQIHLEDVDLDNVLGGPRTVESIEFADGSVLRYADLIARGFDVPGTDFAEALRGSDVVDRITARGGNDQIAGGRGNDVLDGGLGDDTYVIARGDGNDTIREAGGYDRVHWGTGVSAADLRFEHAGPDLIVHGVGGDSLRIEGWHRARTARIELFEFADGSRADAGRLANRAPVALTSAQRVAVEAGSSFAIPLSTGWFRDADPLDTLSLRVNPDASAGTSAMPAWLRYDSRTRTLLGAPPAAFAGDIHLRVSALDPQTASASLAYTLQLGTGIVRAGTAAADSLTGTAWADDLRGGDGHDRLSGLDGADRLFGDAGADVLLGGSGDDRLAGGAGADTLSGQGGSDRYVFARGSGFDTIINRDQAGQDDIVFEDPGLPSELWFSRQGQDLDIMRSGTQDRIRVAGWYAASSDRVDRIAYADGPALLAADVDRLVEAMAQFGPAPASGTVFAPWLASELAPTLAAAWRAG